MLSTTIGSIISSVLKIRCSAFAIYVSSSFSINIVYLNWEKFLISVNFLSYYSSVYDEDLSSVFDEDLSYERLTLLFKGFAS